MYSTPRSLTHPHCDTNRPVWVSNMMHITKLDSAVWCTLYTMKPDSSTLWYELPSVSQLCDAHYEVRLCCMMYIVHQGAWLIHSVMQTGNRRVWVDSVMHIAQCTRIQLQTLLYCMLYTRVEWYWNFWRFLKNSTTVCCRSGIFIIYMSLCKAEKRHIFAARLCRTSGKV